VLNVTTRPLPIEKLRQSITPREDVWLIVSNCPPPLTEPLPATNSPPFGKGGAACVSAAGNRSESGTRAVMSRRLESREEKRVEKSENEGARLSMSVSLADEIGDESINRR
jgi:hypothetical protein